MQTINIAFTHANAELPTRAHPDDAGLDLKCAVPVTVRPGEVVMVRTGVAVEIPSGYVGMLVVRSSVAVKGHMSMANGVGVIDAGYLGEVQVPMVSLDGRAHRVNEGERVAQLVLVPVVTPVAVPVAELGESERGDGGFGSSGR